MSKVSITGNNAGTGTFTIAAPNSNTNRTFNLPDEAGTALTDASDLEPQVKTSLNATGDAPMFACRAFCNFDGDGTVSIRESGNVSSITDNGVSDYTVNFSTSLVDANYAVSGSGGKNDTSLRTVAVPFNLTAPTVSAVRIQVPSADGDLSSSESDYVAVAVFR